MLQIEILSYRIKYTVMQLKVETLSKAYELMQISVNLLTNWVRTATFHWGPKHSPDQLFQLHHLPPLFKDESSSFLKLNAMSELNILLNIFIAPP